MTQEKTHNDLYEEIIIAGFGGQGIIFTGKLLAQTAMEAGKHTTYIPAYGAEVRGGTSNCSVIIAEKEIASPLISNPKSLIAMNKASLNKFTSRIKKGGLLIFNSSLINEPPQDLDGDIEVLALPADELAVELGSKKAANMVALGAYMQKRGIFSPEAVEKSLPRVLAERYHNMLPINNKALHRGAEFAAGKS